MERSILRVVALVLCLVMLVVSLASCKKSEEKIPTPENDAELPNPFANIVVPNNATITELSKSEGEGYEAKSLKNIYDVELFVDMLKACKFYSDEDNVNSVELSHLVALGDTSFFVSSDLTRIYISQSEPENLMQRDVEAYRVEGFGGMEWDLLLQTRDEQLGFEKYLQHVIGINTFGDATDGPRNSIVSGMENVIKFYNMVKACHRTEVEAQPDIIYKYYCTVGNMKFLISDDQGNYRYMCEVSEYNQQGKAIELLHNKTYRVEYFDDELFDSLIQKRENSFFHSMKYLNLDHIEQSGTKMWQLTRVVSPTNQNIYRLRDYLAECEFELIDHYKNGDILPNGSYFHVDTLDYTFYVSPAGDRLVVLPMQTASDGNAWTYAIKGINVSEFNSFIAEFFVFGYENNTTFKFWEFKEEDFIHTES